MKMDRFIRILDQFGSKVIGVTIIVVMLFLEDIINTNSNKLSTVIITIIATVLAVTLLTHSFSEICDNFKTVLGLVLGTIKIDYEDDDYE